MTSTTSAPTISTDQAFAKIGELLRSWIPVLAERDAAHNAMISAETKSFAGRPRWGLSSGERDRLDHLESSKVRVRTASHLKSAVPALAAVLVGSPKMDAGAAFMLIGTHADLSMPLDNEVSGSVLALVLAARPMSHGVEPSPPKKTGRKP